MCVHALLWSMKFLQRVYVEERNMQAQFSLDTSSCKWSIPEVRCSATASSFTARHDMCPARGMLSGKGGQEGEISSRE